MYRIYFKELLTFIKVFQITIYRSLFTAKIILFIVTKQE